MDKLVLLSSVDAVVSTHRLRSLVTVAALFVLATALLPRMRSGKQEPETLRASSVSAKEFVVENPAGKAVARLKGMVQGSVLEFFGMDGSPRLVFSCEPSGKPSIEIKDIDGEARSILAIADTGEAGFCVPGHKGRISVSAADDWGPVLRVGGETHPDFVLLGVRQIGDKQDATLSLQSAKGNSATLVGAANGAVAFVLHDTKRVLRVIGALRESGYSEVSVRGASGKAVVGVVGGSRGQVGLRLRGRAGVERAGLATGFDNQTVFFVKDKNGKIVAGDAK